MKNVITLLMCSLCIIAGIAQSDFNGNSIVIPERTPELKALYQQAKTLENNGTAAQINANRLAIKNAWQAIDPNVAALYKPIVTNKLPETVENLPYNGISHPSHLMTRDGVPELPEDWSGDRFLRDGFIDGLDIDVTGTGDIYIGAYENIIDFGGTFDSIYIYRSTNNVDFDLWKKVGVTAAMRKMQIISMDGSGDEYLLAFLVTDTENFQVWRWDTTTGAFDAEVIASGVTDFGVDRNYPGSTSSQRVFATYKNTGGFPEIMSARSTAGSYGFDWIDATSISGTGGNQVEFAYGLNGGCYTTYTGYSSGNLYANANSNYNDPASWSANETLENGATSESLNPTIRAARKDFASDEVLIVASKRSAGSTDSFYGRAYLRENGGAYVGMDYISAGTDANIAHIDSWMRKVNNDEVIQTSYVRDVIDDSSNDLNRSFQYDGTSFGPFEGVGDSTLNVFDGFASVIAETSDQMPCMAFAGTSAGGTYGYGLYYDAKSTLAVSENSFENFKFYPNPTQTVLNLSAINTIENVSMYSVLGQKVFENTVGQNEASISTVSLKPGVYFMKVLIDGQTATYKIIKQ